MTHAKVLAEFGIEDGQKWRKRIEKEHLDAKTLKRALAKEKGKDKGGRPRRFVHLEEELLRVYSFKIRNTAPEKERRAAMQALEQAQEWLRETGRDDN